MKKTKIIIEEINHQKYSSLVEHFKKYSPIKEDSCKENIYPLSIKSVGFVNGNPPTYHRVEIEASTEVTTPEEKIKVSEAMKGLVEIILGLQKDFG